MFLSKFFKRAMYLLCYLWCKSLIQKNLPGYFSILTSLTILGVKLHLVFEYRYIYGELPILL